MPRCRSEWRLIMFACGRFRAAHADDGFRGGTSVIERIAFMAAVAVAISAPASASGQAPIQASTPSRADQPWRDPKLSSQAPAKAALAAITLDEKLRLAFGFSLPAPTDLAKVPDPVGPPH